jgi:hypothetical protein
MTTNIPLIFGLCVSLGVVAWSVSGALYLWPALRDRSRADALRPLVLLHAFRFLGLAFLVPGVVAADLPAMVARAAGYGDLVACIPAPLTLASLRGKPGIAFAWIFNLWGGLRPVRRVLPGDRDRPRTRPTRRGVLHPDVRGAAAAGHPWPRVPFLLRPDRQPHVDIASAGARA